MDHATTWVKLCQRCDSQLSSCPQELSDAHNLTLTTPPNLPPPLTEELSIRNSLSKLDHAIAVSDAQLAELTLLTESITALRTRLECQRKHLASFLSPIHMLPDEILGEIFLTYAELYGQALTPTHVCGRWRAIGIALSRLWSIIDVPWKGGYSTAYSVDIVNLYLSRSRGCPLDIYIHNGSGEQATRFVYDQTSRWCSARLGVNEGGMSLFPTHGTFPVLEALHLDDFGAFKALPSFSHAPELHSLTLNLVPYHLRDATVLDAQLHADKFPWRQIRKLRCSAGLEDLQGIVQLCTHIEQLDLMQVGSRRSTLRTLEHHFELAHLTQLNILNATDGIVDLISICSAPSLTSFELHGGVAMVADALDYSVIDTVIALLKRSGCKLTRLTLERTTCDPGQLVDLFDSTPFLTHLHFEENCRYSATLSRSYLSVVGNQELLGKLLISDTRARPLLPALEHFHMVLPDTVAESDLDPLLGVLESRRTNDLRISRGPGGSVAYLRTVEFTGFQSVSIKEKVDHWKG